MQHATRIAASVSLAGACVVAGNPVAAKLPDAENATVLLTSDSGGSPMFLEDFYTGLNDVVQTTAANVEENYNVFTDIPAPTLQQLQLDISSYIHGLPADIRSIPGDIAHDFEAAFTALTTPFLPGVFPAGNTDPAYLTNSLNELHVPAYEWISGMLTSGTDQDVLAFLASPASSVLIGAVGPLLDPWLALQDSFDDIVSALHGATPDPQAVLSDLISIPANIIDAVVNGQFLDGTSPTLDLNPLLSLLPHGISPSGDEITSLELAIGGVLSPSGSLFNALGFDVNLGSGESLDVSGSPVGLLGSLDVLDQAVAAGLGFSFPSTPDTAADTLGSICADAATVLSGTGIEADLSTPLTDVLTDIWSLF